MMIPADKLASCNLPELTQEVEKASAAAAVARSELEAAELLLKSARSGFSVARSYEQDLRDFAKALLSTRDPKAQERVRGRYQKKFAAHQEMANKNAITIEGSRQITKENIESMMNKVIAAAAKIAGGENEGSSDATKSAAALAVEVLDADKKAGNGGGGGNPSPQPA